MLWIAGWSLPALVLILSALVSSGVTTIVLASIAVGFLIGLVANLLLGPTCVCHIRTAVQIEKIPSLRRQKRTRRVLSQIRPLIDSVQGTLGGAEEPGSKPEAAGDPSASNWGRPGNSTQMPDTGDNLNAPPVIESISPVTPTPPGSPPGTP